MSWKRRWTIIGMLIAVQVGIVFCYQSFLSGEPVPQTPEKPKPEVVKNELPAPKTVEQTEPKSEPLPTLPVMPASLNTDPPPFPLEPTRASEPISAPPDPKENTVAAASAPVTIPDPVVPPPLADTNPPPAKVVNVPDHPAITSIHAQPAAVPPPQSTAQSPPPLVDVPPPPPPPPVKEETKPPSRVPEAKPAVTCPWKLHVEIVDGRTHITALIGKQVQFRVQCDKLEMQTPNGALDASQSVKLTANGLEGTCDRLTITWQDHHVVLEGKAHLKCQSDGRDVELTAARLSLRMNVSKTSSTSATTTLMPVATSESSEPPLPVVEPTRSPAQRTQPGVGGTEPNPFRAPKPDPSLRGQQQSRQSDGGSLPIIRANDSADLLSFYVNLWR